MKNLSRLTALLCALLLCLSTLAAAEVLPLADTLSSYEAALSAAQEQQEEQAAQEAAVTALFESFMTSESFAELYVDKMLPAINDETGEGLALMQAFTEEQIGALANRIRELYGLIENPTQEDEGDYEDALLTLTMLENGSEAVVYADYFLSGTISSNLEYNLNNDSLWIRGTVTIPAGYTLTIKGTGLIDHYNPEAYVLFNVKGTLIINGNITINCPTSTVYAGTSRAITNSGTVELNNVTIKGFKSTNTSSGYGYEGGAINNSGTLTITSSTIENCFAYRDGGAIYNTGTATLNNVQFTNCYTTGNNMWGGAIANLGDLVIENNSSFTECKAMEGGAIWDIGNSMSISDSTFTKCSANSSGGAILYGRSGETNPATINSILDKVTIQGCTADSGSAIMIRSYTNGSITMQNESVIQNCTAAVKDDCGGTIRTNGGVNVAMTIDGCTIKNNNGGNNGGAIYWNANGASSMLTVRNSSITGNKTAGNGGGMFLEGARMNFSSTVVSNNEAGENGGGICINSYGGGMNVGMSASDSFNLTLNDGFKVQNNTAENGGGVAFNLYNADPAHKYTYNVTILEGAEITGNNATNDGGGIWVRYKENTKNTSKVGSVREYNVNAKIEGGLIAENTAGNNGGAFFINRSYAESTDITYLVEMSGGTVKENEAPNGNGGAIYLNNGTMIMSGGEIIGFDTVASAKNGGGAYITGGDFTMTGGTIKDSKASADGGGVYVNGGKVVIGTEGSISHDKPLLTNNTAVNGGAVAVANATEIPVMHNGTMTGNEATQNGGAVYVTGKGFTLKNGLMTKNSAVDGGAVYVSGGAFTMENGTLGGSAANKNTATNGGAVYVTGGEFLMTNGSIDNNQADNNGGAVYLNEGNFKMEHGSIDENSAIRGGAVYVAGSSTTEFRMESGTMSSNTASEDGGAVYATSGKMYIGLVDCDGGTSNAKHEELGAGRHHPQINENKAGDTGGGISISESGVVHFYCGQALNNEANRKGLGNNVFMEGGDFYIYAGSDIGSLKDPELVIVGGNLHNKYPNSGDYLTLRYYKTNISDFNQEQQVYTGQIAKEEYMNLPEGEGYFWDNLTVNGEEWTFVGWSAKGEKTLDEKYYVRDRSEYMNSGDPVRAVDAATYVDPENGNTVNQPAWDNNADGTIHLYGVWVPKTYTITYVNGVTREEANYSGSYSLNKSSDQTANIPPLEYPGYIVAGWYVYQNEGMNANWGHSYEPVYTSQTDKRYATLNLDGMQDQYIPVDPYGSAISLTIPMMTFGDITLVADLIPAYGRLKITKEVDDSKDPYQTFVFHVEGYAKVEGMPDTDMTVVIPGNGSTIIEHLPVGDYTVTEDTSWSWRYTPDAASKTAKIENPSVTPEVEFTNNRTSDKWLDGNAYADNQFGAYTTQGNE